MEIFIAVVYLFVFLLIIYKLPFFSLQNISRKFVVLSVVYRMVLASVFIVTYTHFYTDRTTADMYRYYDDAGIMYSALSENPPDFFRMLSGFNDQSQEIQENYYMKMNTWYKSYEYLVPNDNRTMVRWNAFLMLFSFGSFYVAALFFVIMGYLGIFFLFKSFQMKHPVHEKILFLALMFFPSLTFWTSGISKEALVVFALGGFLFTFMKLISKKFNVLNVLFFIVFAYMLFTIKIYVLLFLIPVIIAYLWGRTSKSINLFLKFCLSISVFLILIWNFHYVVPGINFVDAFVRQQHDFISFAKSIDAGSIINGHVLQPNVLSFLKAVPVALINVFFRPFFFDSHNLLMFAVSVENFVFIVAIFGWFFLINRKFRPDAFFWLCVTFSLMFFTVIGLSTPVTGAIVRYKVVGFPFLFGFLIQMMNSEKVSNKLIRILNIV